MHEVARLQSLRRRAEGVERARLARELHDGVIQTLIGVDMQLEVLARRSGGTPAERATAISAIQTTLRRETVNLRDLTEEMKIGVAEVSAERVLDEVANLVDRFQRQTGIAAKFAGERVAVRLPPNARREVLRVVHEGLVNVRKHSGARHVLVRASVSSDRLRLSIEDDGRGFSFQGTLTQQELESQLQGPAGSANGCACSAATSHQLGSRPRRAYRYDGAAEGKRIADTMGPILIADDHRIFRDGLRRLLEVEPDFEVVGEASDGRDAIALVREVKPDILLHVCRCRGVDGLEALRGISEQPGPRERCC